MLYSGKNSGHTDSFKTTVIDTIVAEIQSVPGEDRCVLLLGYKEQMQEMFQVGKITWLQRDSVNRKLEERQPRISSSFRNRECIRIRGLH